MSTMPVVDPFLSDKTKTAFEECDNEMRLANAESNKIDQEILKLQSLSPKDQIELLDSVTELPRRRLKAKIKVVELRRKRIDFISDVIIPELRSRENSLISELPEIELSVRKKSLKAGWLDGPEDQFGTITRAAILRHPDYRNQQNKILNLENAIVACTEAVRKSRDDITVDEIKIKQLSIRMMTM